jgi:hypothetical protein
VGFVGIGKAIGLGILSFLQEKKDKKTKNSYVKISFHVSITNA